MSANLLGIACRKETYTSMLRMLVLPLLLTLSGTAHAQKATYKIGPLVIEAPWARATSAGAKVGAGYMKITNTAQEPDRLIGGSVSLATEVAVHEMAMRGGIPKMRRLEGGLEIGPGQTELKPGGYHLMFMGLRQGLREGETMKGTLVFEKAGTVGVEYHVRRIGAQ
jgi:periplasmic copper chaperone A